MGCGAGGKPRCGGGIMTSSQMRIALDSNGTQKEAIWHCVVVVVVRWAASLEGTLDGRRQSLTVRGCKKQPCLQKIGVT